MLLVVDGFTWTEFWLATLGAMAGIWALSAAFSDWLFAPLYAIERALLAVAAILLVAPDLTATLIGVAIIAPIMARQLMGIGRMTLPAARSEAA